MRLTQDQIDEINALLLFNPVNPQEGIKVHSDAEPSRIEAVRRLNLKGLISQSDGGYMTDLGREAVEHINMALTILTTR